MIRKILIFVLLLTPTFCFSKTTLYIPSEVNVDPNNPSSAFPENIQQNFLISANSNTNACQKSQPYILTMLIYRNAVDNKVVSTYRAKNESSLCWIDLISYSNKWLPDPTVNGWKIPKVGENTWCSREGLINPFLCSLIS